MKAFGIVQYYKWECYRLFHPQGIVFVNAVVLGSLMPWNFIAVCLHIIFVTIGVKLKVTISEMCLNSAYSYEILKSLIMSSNSVCPQHKYLDA